VTIHVFAGPTISAGDVLARLPGALVSGPVAFGDVYRAARQKPTAIAIIDGYFERVPATWHKEVLWAMSEGVHVFGASSMGALRAAELCEFGMVGVGAIFEAFRDGELEDDDEVAIAHGSSETGFVPASEAMVNIRATLRRAAAAGVIGRGCAEALTTLAKGTFYAQRCYPALVEAGASAGLDAAELGRFRVWVSAGRVDQKRDDAEQLLAHLATWRASNPKPKRVTYGFEATDAWHEAERIAQSHAPEPAQGRASVDDDLLDELKLDDAYRAARAAAASFGWSLDAARRAGVRPDALAIRTAVETFRRDAGLTERQAFEQWRRQQRMDDAALARFFEDRARASWAEPLGESLAQQHLVHHLQACASYGPLRERAALKAQRLQQLGLAAPSLADAKLGEEELWQWFFGQRLERQAPPDLDVFARQAGFSGTDELRRAALREYCFQTHGAPEPRHKAPTSATKQGGRS
jgi:hypothetical protein